MPEKIYSSNAERQRAYRERKKAERRQASGELSQEDRAALVAVLTKYRKHPLKKDVREEVDRLLTLLGGKAGKPTGRPAEDMAYRPIPGELPLL